MEILNFHSHTNRSITINIKESEIVYVTNLRNFFLNITKVEVLSYTDTKFKPNRAQIVMTKILRNYYSKATQFNIVVDAKLKLVEALDRPGYTTGETDIFSMTSAAFIVNRGDLAMSNIDVSRDSSIDVNDDVAFVTANYLQTHTVQMKDMDFQISGMILMSREPMTLLAENINVDFYAMSAGFQISAS